MIYTDKYGVKRTTETYAEAQAKQYSNFSDNELIKFNNEVKQLHAKAQYNNDWKNEYYYGRLADESEIQLKLRNVIK